MGQKKLTPKEFISAYHKYAKQTEEKMGISSVFILAQAALESGWGEHAPGNMFFGVKATNDTPLDKRQLLVTTEVFSDEKQGYRFPAVLSVEKRTDGKYTYKVKDWFRKYNTPDECFSDHSDFFYKNKRYAQALNFKSNPNRFSEEIAKAGYATAPNYASTLKTIIKMIEQNL